MVAFDIFRIERRVDRRDNGALPAQHVLQHMIAPDAQRVADDLQLGVPIADVPGEPHQIGFVRQ